MKILNKDQIREADAYTIEHEPIHSIALMERASNAFVRQFIAQFHPQRPVKIFAGKGNNGGDGLAIGRLLLEKGYEVTFYIVHYTAKASDDHQTNRERLKQWDEVRIVDIEHNTPLPEPSPEDVVIDALWGSGLSRPVEGFARNVIQAINESKASVVAVDIPSGVYCDGLNEDPLKIEANHTYTFQFPKLTFMLAENQNYVGEFKILDIGLNEEFIASLETPYFYTTEANARTFLRPRKKFEHKGNFGHALVIGGSHGKIGAPLMAGRGCLRSGAGLLTSYIPACGYTAFQTSLSEAMVLTDSNEAMLTKLPELSGYDAIGIGPGMGTEPATAEFLTNFLKQHQGPKVLDADALNLLAQNPHMQADIDAQTILTPHPGEFDRLAGEPVNSEERLKKLKAEARRLNCVIVLKGAYSAIANPEGQVFFNATGNPGMATGGTGDALTGILTGILAQGYEPQDAAIFGTYLHGFAGDLAGCSKGLESLMAGDLIDHIPEAFKQLHNQPRRQ